MVNRLGVVRGRVRLLVMLTAATSTGSRPPSYRWVIAMCVLAALAACGSSHSATARSTAVTDRGAAPAQSGTGAEAATSTTTNSTSTQDRCQDGIDISAWSIRQRVARLIVVPSLNFDIVDLEPVISLGVGGVLFLGSNPAPSDLRGRIAMSTEHPQLGVSVLTMADEEGGGVSRLRGVVDEFAWARKLGATMSTAEVERLSEHIGQQMRTNGIDMDLAPVLDADGGAGPSATNPDGQRSFSADPVIAGRYGVAFAKGLELAGVLSVGKHFPGLGESVGNSDNGNSATRPWSTLRRDDIRSFKAAIDSGIPGIMVANDVVPGLASGPASLSPVVIRTLREELGFQGAVLTDSLSAGSIQAAGYSLPIAAAAAVRAGADLVLFGSTLDAHEKSLLTPAHVLASTKSIIDAIAADVTRGALSIDRLDEAVSRVLHLKGLNTCTGSAT